MTKKQKELVEKIKLQLLEEVDNSDLECAHASADRALCELLKGFGFTEPYFNSINKYYDWVSKYNSHLNSLIRLQF